MKLAAVSRGGLWMATIVIIAQPVASFGFLPEVQAWRSLALPRKAGMCTLMRMEDDRRRDSRDLISRRSSVGSLFIGTAAAAIPLVLKPTHADAKAGDYAKIELDGRGGDSVSSLGKNDIPGAGKIDPFENRETANAEYAARMSDSSMLEEKRIKAISIKTKVFAAVAVALDAQDWKAAKLPLDRDLGDLRRAMNLVSTRGKKAVSAAQKG